MSSNALDSQGMVIQVGTSASPIVWSTIPEVSEMSGPGGQAAEIDVTDLSSTAKEFRMGLQDEGQISLTMNWIPANTVHATLRTARSNQTLTNFQIIFTDSPQTKWRFQGFVLGLEISNSVDDVTKATVTLRVSGSITEL
jgi:hypothetical protein